MTNKIYNLNKTNIKDGVQCIKKLWFNFHEPIKIRDSAEFHKGDRFGLIVRKNYGDGLDLSGNFNIKEVVSKTEEALKSKNINVIYEGAFIFKKTLVRTDVLIKNKDGYDGPNYWELFAQFYYSGITIPAYCRPYARPKHPFKTPGMLCLNEKGVWQKQ